MKFILAFLLFIPVISFSQKINGLPIPQKAKDILLDLMKEAGVTEVTVTSTTRTPAEQTAIMYNYIKTYGVANTKRLYGPEGDSVTDVYVRENNAGKNETDIKQAMLEELKKQLPNAVANNRLMHVNRDDKFIVFDISISKLKPLSMLKKIQEVAVKMENKGIIFRFLGTGSGEQNALHFEIEK